ncbi:MAG: 30S ribosomal protein S20 [Clostridia bacterium]|nr:30S ribosomal protein S20 [Clostridia bacterium]
MANIKSQKKRILITKKENTNNISKRSKVKNMIKKYETAIAENNVELATEMLPQVVSVIDSAKSDGVYKQNTVSRKVAHLSKLLSDLKKAE